MLNRANEPHCETFGWCYSSYANHQLKCTFSMLANKYMYRMRLPKWQFGGLLWQRAPNQFTISSRLDSANANVLPGDSVQVANFSIYISCISLDWFLLTWIQSGVLFNQKWATDSYVAVTLASLWKCLAHIHHPNVSYIN